LLVILIVLVATDNCQGPLRGAVLDHTQDVHFLQAVQPVSQFKYMRDTLYSISMIALISLAKVRWGFYTPPNFI
jgi:hypothetical protein